MLAGADVVAQSSWEEVRLEGMGSGAPHRMMV